MPISKAMISVVIPTLNAGDGLAATLTALVPASVAGIVREVIVADCGSSDATLAIAEAAGAVIVPCQKGRGTQLHAGAAVARAEWLLFLHADTRLEHGWADAAAAFMAAGVDKAAAFRFALDDRGLSPRLLEWGVRLRCALFRLPYGDQGLLLPAAFYRELGGYKPIPLMEDVELVGRIGRGRLAMLGARAITSAVRYRRDGYPGRVVRNLTCLALYYLRVPPARIAKLYG